MSARLLAQIRPLLALGALGLCACEGSLSGGEVGQDTPERMGGAGRDATMVDMSAMMTPDLGAELDLSSMADMPADMTTAPALAQGPWSKYLNPDYNPNIALAGKQAELFAGGDPQGDGHITVQRIRRMESMEWVRNTGRWTTNRHTSASRAEDNPFELANPHSYSTYRQGISLNKDELARYLDILPEAGVAWSQRPGNTGKLYTTFAQHPGATCVMEQPDGALPQRACVEDFARLYLREAVYFRPPTPEEVELLSDFAMDVLSEVAPGAYDAKERALALEAITSFAWMTTPALFHKELGEAGDVPGRLELSAWEIAHLVSHAIARKAPGSPAAYIHHGGTSDRRVWAASDPEHGHMFALEQAALDGTITDRDKLAALIRASLGGVDADRRDLEVEWYILPSRSARGEYWLGEGVQQFFREWLEVGEYDTKFKDSSWSTSKYDGMLDAADLRRLSGSYEHLSTTGVYSSEPLYTQQLDDMIARIVVEDEQVFEKLLTSKTFHTPRGAYSGSNNGRGQMPQYVYGIEQEHTTREQRWQTLPERAGVLTHPVWLAAHSDNFENGTGIIYRGKWVRERLLCGWVPPVSGDIPAQLVPGEGKSARQRVDESTAPDACAGCHGLMNSLGKPFEIYNHAGFARAFDQGGAPDGSSTLEAMPAGSGLEELVVTDALDFAGALGGSEFARQCFIRQTFRYFMGRPETLHDAYTLSQMQMTYLMTGGSFIEMLVTLMTSDAFLQRLPLTVLQPSETSP